MLQIKNFMLTTLLVNRLLVNIAYIYEHFGAPNFCAGAPNKKKLGAPVQPVQKVSLEPCFYNLLLSSFGEPV